MTNWEVMQQGQYFDSYLNFILPHISEFKEKP